jgi:hypothetical protein
MSRKNDKNLNRFQNSGFGTASAYNTDYPENTLELFGNFRAFPKTWLVSGKASEKTVKSPFFHINPR